METSSEIGKLAEALSKAQGKMPSALKTAVNNAFARGSSKGSKYATLADCAEAAHPVMSEFGLSMIQGICGTEFVARLAHSSGEWVQIRIPIPGDLSVMTIQQLMACQTYLRRASYSLVGLVADEDDDGNEAAKVGAVKAYSSAHTPIGDVNPTTEDREFAIAMAAARTSSLGPAAVMQLHAELKSLGEERYRNVWSLLDSKTRTAIKEIINGNKAAA